MQLKKTVAGVIGYGVLIAALALIWNVHAAMQEHVDSLQLDKGQLQDISRDPDRWLSTWLKRNGECSNFAELRDNTDTEDNRKRLYLRIVHNFWRTLDRNRGDYNNPTDLHTVNALYDKFPLKAYSCMQSGDPDMLYYIPEDYTRLIM